MQKQRNLGMYRREFEHDACGVGLIADLDNIPSHRIVANGLTVLKRLMHRGAVGNDPETGDGAGMLVQIPDAFFRRHVGNLPPAGEYAVAMIFDGCGEEPMIESIIKERGAGTIAWRDVPVDPDAIGRTARSTMPRIRQLFVKGTDERGAFVLRRMIEKRLKNGYICSFSTRTVVYKGLLLAPQVERFYPDLAENDFTSALALVHQRYSTNTFPTWKLAHPFRMLAHNGEINTIRGNLNQLRAREKSLSSTLLGKDLEAVLPLIDDCQSDSASLDNIFELLVAAGRDPAHAMLMLMPQAWGEKYHMGHDVRGFYEYHSALMEPWDGPAAVAFTDGISAGAALDRNGLRPARWTLTKDNLFILASETGVLDIKAEDIVRHGRVKPGSMIFLDLPQHRLIEDAEIKTRYARRRPYRRWVEENHIEIQGLFSEIVPSKVPGDLVRRQQRFDYTQEDIDLILEPMARDGKEPVGSMGNDAALACRSHEHRSLFDCFHQLFAQVTNPPIDPIREELVMSLMTYIGNNGNILEETPEHAHLIRLNRPVLTDDELHRLSKVGDYGYPVTMLSTEFSGPLNVALEDLGKRAVEAVGSGSRIIVLSDRASADAPIPAILALSSVNRALVDAGLRTSTGVIVQSGEVREVHHFAVLLGYGATAINPYLALETISSLFPNDPVTAAANYINAVDKGLMKIMSKMGISTLRSYRSAQIFEIVGLAAEIVERYFSGTPSRIGGRGFREIERDLFERPPSNATCSLSVGGLYGYRKGTEDHLWTPQTVSAFRQAVRTNDYAKFKEYSSAVDAAQKRSCTLRGLFAFAKTSPIDISQVEPAESIMKRFVGGAMSLGSLSPEAHEAIALAFNSIGSMSNSGEGGLNSERFGTDTDCGIKQVASGRFGVTLDYLRSARDLQIKLAQGAKPGEGGQLPAHKVNDFVARLRHARPGMTLISPPPHHDTYSIEDLAQLIYDLRCANPKARISVKLVSEAGVGTIAAGVAKAHADVVLISGFDGGTGAAPLTSTKHAGLPWELGLAEAQQTLVKNGLRGRIKVQVDGQLKTGRDIMIAALLGAEEFGFGTTLLVALGCIQDRRCHCDTCPVGIATQCVEKRKLFAGSPAHIVNFLRFLAEETREHLAELGLRSIDEAVGRTEFLKNADPKTGFDFSGFFVKEQGDEAKFTEGANPYVFDSYDRHQLIPEIAKCPLPGSPYSFNRIVHNTDRTVGTEFAGEVSAKYDALADDAITVNFNGTAGQSFGAFLSPGITFNLTGEANDFVGKGLSGGIIAIKPPRESLFRPEDNIIAGNVIAYGATGGRIFLNGQAGERFGIRNSGVTMVVEGIGDHGCEYMTGGEVVILGPTGVNFGAGMTGGTAYVLDEAGDFDLRCNLVSIDLATVDVNSRDEHHLHDLIREHIRRTGSPLGKRLLENWTAYRPRFVKVIPVKEN
ncbi:MAG: glutamate synthase large subunit [Kiritimatiellae bacterium]|nr:glutamate synthase large subunit [Kiritimatiellia bacterium]